MTTPDYDQFCEVLDRAGSELSGAESHGLLSGLLCMGKTAEVQDTLLSQLLPPDHSPGNPVILELKEALRQVYEDTVQQINDSLLEYSLLLPGERQTLAVRTEALAHWCQGFIFGLGLGGYKEPENSDGDAVELIRDFSEISKAGYDDHEVDDEEEAAFIEVEEYVRVGVLLILEELQPVKLQSPIVH